MEKKFHEILKEARINAGLTQSQLAERIGVAKSTYCNWEQGTREPNVLKLKAIAKALGVTGDYLLGMEERNSFHAMQKSPRQLLHCRGLVFCTGHVRWCSLK